MARRLGNSRKKTSKKKGRSKKNREEESNWVTLAQVLENDDGSLYFKGEDYYGDLLFRDSDGNLYKINNASIFDPLDNAPDFVQNVIRVNLEGKSVEPVDTEDLD